VVYGWINNDSDCFLFIGGVQMRISINVGVDDIQTIERLLNEEKWRLQEDKANSKEETYWQDQRIKQVDDILSQFC
jgi:hypothetical protein